jgi:hypothetical protein
MLSDLLKKKKIIAFLVIINIFLETKFRNNYNDFILI